MKAYQLAGACLLLLLAVCTNGVAQPKHWRVGVATQYGPSFAQFSRDVTFDNHQLGFEVEPARAILLTAERRLTAGLWFTAGIGQLQPQAHTFNRNHTMANPAGRPILLGGSTTATMPSRSFASVGLAMHSRSFGPFNFRAGLAAQVRYNPATAGGFIGLSTKGTTYLTSVA